MLTCEIDLTGFRRAAQRSIDTIHTGVRDAVRAAAEEGAQYAKDVGSFKDKTGNLRAHIRAEPVSSNIVGSVWAIVSPEKYSVFVENPTKAHRIYPKAGYNLKGPVRNGQTRRATGKGPHESVVGRGRALRWTSGGTTFFAAWVDHPGTKGFPFLGPALQKAERVMYRELETIATKLRSIWHV